MESLFKVFLFVAVAFAALVSVINAQEPEQGDAGFLPEGLLPALVGRK